MIIINQLRKPLSVVLKTIKLISFALTLLFLIITAGYYYLFEREAPGVADEYYHQNVQDQITESIRTVRSDLEPIGLSVPVSDGELSRDDLPSSSYPYYIFKDGNIKFWSDNFFVPEFAQIEEVGKAGILTAEAGKFLIIRSQLGSSDYICVSLIPICKRSNANSSSSKRLITEILPENISSKLIGDKYKAIVSLEDDIIFYLKAPEINGTLQSSLPDNTLKLLGLSFFFLCILCTIQAGEYIKEHNFGRAFLVIASFLLFARWLLLVNNISLIKFQPSGFNPTYLTGNPWDISLGDRLINSLIVVILVGFLASYFYRSTAYYYTIKSKQLTRSFFAVICVVLVFIISYLLTSELNSVLVFSNGEYSYGLTTNFDSAKIALFVYFILLSTIFFLASHSLIYAFSKLFPQKVGGFLHWLYGFILSFILLAIANDLNWIYLLVGLYFLLVYYFQLSRSFYVLRFKTSLYFFLSAFLFAALGTVVLHQYFDLKKRNDVQEVSRSIFSNNDLIFEKLIAKKIADIEADESIRAAIVQQTLAWERVTRQVKDNHLADLINGYQSGVYVFDPIGINLDILPDSKSFAAWKNDFELDGVSMPKSRIYKMVNPDGNVLFYGEANIKEEDGTILGTVLVEFDYLLLTHNLKNFNGFQVVSVFAKSEVNDYSFGLFDSENNLVDSEGTFNYIDKWNSNLNKSDELLTVGVVEEGFRHYGVKNTDGRMLIVSLPDDNFLNDWANLSFLFLISVFVISFILIIYGFRHGYSKRSQMNFTTRIQLYLNTAFLLPLLLILIIAISVVGTTLRRNQENGFKENTASLASTVQLVAADFFSGKMSKAYFEQELNGLAQNSKAGFSIYNENGKQEYVANQGFETLPAYLNSKAFTELIEKNERQVLLEDESYGEIHLSSYVGIYPILNNQKLVIGVPHVGSGLVLNRHLTTVISSILNIFIFLFIFLLIAAFFVSRQLTNPIRTVTRHLRKTNLDKLDEPLLLKETNDEMGVLVRAYNRMLEKLEESKIALSNSEKQTAWREMAKQVAHEIKNPLTPMKLSIQQLQRTLPVDNPKSKQRIERALNSLNEQIDNISEIANSFSEFAKMPVPTSEEFDLVEVIQKVADLYTTNKNSDFQLNFLQPKLMVRGDRQLMSRVLTNLIINGLQSVSIDKRPKIEISAYKNEEDSFAIVEVRDNGVGVPEEIHEKVFIPNFSTKVGGSGLGLALAKRGIEHGGGNIWFDTEANVGTAFYVDLPLAR
ncbi:MAG: two-component system nitrogen regulation sensor histidine kinase NtrY [Spirosomataceae bacterium]|jgi:signal transduction histidine kinase